MPSTAEKAANRIVVSKAARDERRPAVERACRRCSADRRSTDVPGTRARSRPARRRSRRQEHDSGTRVRGCRSASASSSIGNGEYASSLRKPASRAPASPRRPAPSRCRTRPSGRTVRCVSTCAMASLVPCGLVRLGAGRIVRISKIEIIGRTRTNRNISAMNRPIVPRRSTSPRPSGSTCPTTRAGSRGAGWSR